MEVRKITNTPSFQAIRISNDVPKVLKDAIAESRAFDKFGKRYNANVSFSYLASSSNRKHPALLVSDIEPVSLYRKIIDNFRNIKNRYNQFLYITTGGTTDEHFAKKIANASDDYVINKYHHAMQNK